MYLKYLEVVKSVAEMFEQSVRQTFLKAMEKKLLSIQSIQAEAWGRFDKRPYFDGHPLRFTIDVRYEVDWQSQIAILQEIAGFTLK